MFQLCWELCLLAFVCVAGSLCNLFVAQPFLLSVFTVNDNRSRPPGFLSVRAQSTQTTCLNAKRDVEVNLERNDAPF